MRRDKWGAAAVVKVDSRMGGKEGVRARRLYICCHLHLQSNNMWSISNVSNRACDHLSAVQGSTTAMHPMVIASVTDRPSRRLQAAATAASLADSCSCSFWPAPDQCGPLLSLWGACGDAVVFFE
jgi:hypothetical protein